MVDDLALLVHHVVVLEQMLADIEVVRFDLLLGILDRSRNPPMLDRNAVLHADAVHQALETVSAEDSEQVVLEREIKTRRTGITLAARTPAQLVIDSPRLVALRAEDMKSARLNHEFALTRAYLAMTRQRLLELRVVGVAGAGLGRRKSLVIVGMKTVAQVEEN